MALHSGSSSLSFCEERNLLHKDGFDFLEKRTILLRHAFQFNPSGVFVETLKVSVTSLYIRMLHNIIKTVSGFICIFPEFGYLHSVFLKHLKCMIPEPFQDILELVGTDMINPKFIHHSEISLPFTK